MELRAGVIGGGISAISSCWGDWGCDCRAAAAIDSAILSLGVFRDFNLRASTTAALSNLALFGATPRPKPVPSVSPTPTSTSEPL